MLSIERKRDNILQENEDDFDLGSAGLIVIACEALEDVIEGGQELIKLGYDHLKGRVSPINSREARNKLCIGTITLLAEVSFVAFMIYQKKLYWR